MFFVNDLYILARRFDVSREFKGVQGTCRLLGLPFEPHSQLSGLLQTSKPPEKVAVIDACLLTGFALFSETFEKSDKSRLEV